MAKFKIGDWVRATVADSKVGVGGVGRVTENHPVPLVDWLRHGKWAYVEGELEPWTPRVGERVRAVKTTLRLKNGRIYNIVAGHRQAAISNGFFVDLGSEGVIEFSTKCFEPVQNEPSAKLRLEAGKFYRTRDGRKVGPMSGPDRAGDFYSGGYYDANGLWLGEQHNAEFNRHLIAEWHEEPAKPAPVAAQVDAIADEYGSGVKEQPKFKVGDRVRLLPGYAINAKAGATATVGPKGLYGAFVDLVWDRNGMDKGQMDGSYFPDRFELIQPTPPQPSIVCLIEDGQPKPATKLCVHASKEAAATEAARLAAKHKGQEFGVYMLAESKKQPHEHEWQRLLYEGKHEEAKAELMRVSGVSADTARIVLLRAA